MAKKKAGRPKGSKNRKGSKRSPTVVGYADNPIKVLENQKAQLQAQLKKIDKIIRELKKLG